jgi:hypothetical protein
MSLSNELYWNREHKKETKNDVALFVCW